MHADGTPHSTNARATIENDPDLWIGLEQEYFLFQDGRPLGFPENGHPSTPQGPYYCGVGYKYMGSLARQIVEEHWTSVLPPASIMKASTRKSPKASGNSRSSPKAPPKPPTTPGPLAI
jgi:glutamine synthetase